MRTAVGRWKRRKYEHAEPKSIRKGHANKNMVEAKDMTTIICEMDSMELCVWKEKHLQRACSGDEWIFREKEKEPEGIRVNFDVTHAYEIFSCLGRYWGDFNSCPDSETMGRVAKRWEEKYGLKLVELSHDTLTFQSDRRISKKEAVEITEETVELCAEIVNGKENQQIETISRTGRITLWWD